MTDKLLCPFCQQKLHKDPDGYYTCYTDNCGCWANGGNGASGSESLWLTLIDTKKKLDIAVDAIDYIKKNCMTMIEAEGVCRRALEQINNKEEK